MKIVERGKNYKYKDNEAYRDLICYCCNPLKAAHIGTVNLKSIETAAVEMEAVTQRFHKEFGKRLSHIIISFSPQEVQTVSKVEWIARACAQYYGDRYQVLYCVHATSNIHIHMIVNRVSFVDGRKYPDKYEDRQAFWCHVHHVLRDYGIQLWK